MQLLAKKEAQIGIKKDNEELIVSNIRLRGMEKQVIERLNEAKLNYDPEKMKALKDFEAFVAEINEKKSKLLAELNALDSLIEERKEIYYGLIEKQDLLEEKINQVEERERKVELREVFATDLERKIREKQV